MNIIADLHLHTNISHHAFSTVFELCLAAALKKLKAIAITDHGPAIPDGAHEWHFPSQRILPRKINGVYLLRGAEVNVLDVSGKVDLSEGRLRTLDFVIASMHDPVYRSAGEEANTQAWLNVINNAHVNCLGHLGNPQYSCDYEAVVKACKEKGKIIEINASSFRVRKGSAENCKKIAELCMEYGVQMAVNSDGHFMSYVGEVKPGVELLESVGCPEELVINSSENNLKEYFKNVRGLDMDI